MPTTARKLQVIPAQSELAVPSDPFGDVWLTVDEVVALGRSERRVLMNIASKKWESRTLPRIGSAGKAPRQVALTALPEDLQRRWLAMRHQPVVEDQPTDETPLEELKPITNSTKP